PESVIKEMVAIQRRFLWTGGAESRKVCWVGWITICLSKNLGGLGIKNLEAFNISFLSEWKWRFLVDANSIWYDLLTCRYGNLCEAVTGADTGSAKNQQSLWWRNLVALSYSVHNQSDWFTEGVKIRLGDGTKVKFWSDNWLGSDSFMQVLPRLYTLSADRRCTLADAGNWCDGIWRQTLAWQHTLFSLEETVTTAGGYLTLT
ncbi:putative ribonuclease H protein, partial [Trifolium medium]|nr:putative ribonuclease H protein [Trifolium medium]